jgi:hypothetical protein
MTGIAAGFPSTVYGSRENGVPFCGAQYEPLGALEKCDQNSSANIKQLNSSSLHWYAAMVARCCCCVLRATEMKTGKV